MSVKSKGWIRIPIHSGFLNEDDRNELRRQAAVVAERCGAKVIKDCGERAERFEEVEPPAWVRFYLFQIQRLGWDAS